MKIVLIADDQSVMRTLVRATLESGQLVVLEAADGTDALTLARQHRPDLIFLDWSMPGMSGIEVCRELRSDPRTADIVVVMFTARDSAQDRELAFGHGADRYITKPFSPMELTDVIRTALGPEVLTS